MADINEKTRIPLFAVFVAVPVVCVAILWLAAIQYTAVNAEKVNAEQDTKIKENRQLIENNWNAQWGKLLEINERTIRIEERQKKKGE